MTVRDILSSLVELLAPTRCAACGRPGHPICATCASCLETPSGPRCATCRQLTSIDLQRCPECPGARLECVHGFGYQGPLPEIIHALKDRSRTDLARPLAELVAREVDPLPGGTVLVPVPLSARRLRERGYNQAELLAVALGREWGLPVRDLLVRTRDDPHQRGAGRDARAKQVRGAFAARTGTDVRRVALVDDVHTTGATLAACARSLRATGVNAITAIAVARVWPSYPSLDTVRHRSDTGDEESD